MTSAFPIWHSDSREIITVMDRRATFDRRRTSGRCCELVWRLRVDELVVYPLPTVALELTSSDSD